MYDPFIYLPTKEAANSLFLRQQRFGCESPWVSLQVQLYEEAIDDGILGLVADLPRLSTLHISSSRITNASVSVLRRNQDLRELRIYDAKLTPEVFESLAEMPNLRVLELPASAKPNDEPMMQEKVPNLEVLEYTVVQQIQDDD